MKVLGIESSCDETGVAIIDESGKILSERLYSQIELHAEYGGVVPELASRDHIRKITPLLKETLNDANLSLEDIDSIAYRRAWSSGGVICRRISWTIDCLVIGDSLHSCSSHGSPFAGAIFGSR